MTLQHYRELIASFRKDISSVIHLLVHFQIKVDLRIENLAAVEE